MAVIELKLYTTTDIARNPLEDHTFVPYDKNVDEDDDTFTLDDGDTILVDGRVDQSLVLFFVEVRSTPTQLIFQGGEHVVQGEIRPNFNMRWDTSRSDTLQNEIRVYTSFPEAIFDASHPNKYEVGFTSDTGVRVWQIYPQS